MRNKRDKRDLRDLRNQRDLRDLRDLRDSRDLRDLRNQSTQVSKVLACKMKKRLYICNVLNKIYGVLQGAERIGKPVRIRRCRATV